MLSKLRTMLGLAPQTSPGSDTHATFPSRAVSPDFAVCPQIRPEDVPHITAAGFRTVICVRPDNEEAGQPPREAIAAACTQAGLDFAYVPVPGGGSGDAVLMRATLDSHPSPVLAYCRSGARAVHLWQAATALNGSPDAQ